MELKGYQKDVLANLTKYLALLRKTNNIIKAYNLFWKDEGLSVGPEGMPPYQDIIPGVPDLCMKVPTGGGKTYLACNAIAPIFDAMPFLKMKTVVWLVPSEAILSQTLAALRNPDHPYREAINAHFGSSVEVYTKEQLLNGQNFNITAVTEQLSIMVLSYDSFRGRKEQLKAKQENSALVGFAKFLGTPDMPLADADETALLQVINQLNPLVIVDESHHARSNLSKKMLQDFNPCFVLDLTATPTKESNIIAFVDSTQLKTENMVKLPVVVYNRQRQDDVIMDAIYLRDNLERQAEESRAADGYIRPIVLFQAQPKGKEDSTTFEKLRRQLVDIGIPAEQIAIKTADINELKGVNLMSEACPVRYIITVNALKEGWDCPFAYVLATLANRTSKIDVEQIVGRILRQPYARKHSVRSLNMSYVLTSSSDFSATLDGIVAGLNGAGFSRRDCRVAAEEEAPAAAAPVQVDFDTVQQTDTPTEQTAAQPASGTAVAEVPSADGDEPEFLNFDPAAISAALQQVQKDPARTPAQDMLDKAEQQQDAFMQAMQEHDKDGLSYIPQEVRDKVKSFGFAEEFKDEAAALCLPHFFIKIPESLFTDGMTSLLCKEALLSNFTLNKKPCDINFDTADDEIVEVDIADNGSGVPKMSTMDSASQKYFREQFGKKSSEERIRLCKELLYHQLNKMDSVESADLKQYIDRVVGCMERETLDALEKSTHAFADKIKKYIEDLQADCAKDVFNDGLECGKITVEPSYKFPPRIVPPNSTDKYRKSLYTAEADDMNKYETDMVLKMTGMPNIKWWHRNAERKGFCLNGYINHYPDFIAMTTSGKILLIETKGDQLNNPDSMRKLDIGRKWQAAAGKDYRYFMIFQDKAPEKDGAYSFDGFLKILSEL